MEKQLNFTDILTNAFSLGLKNLFSVIGCIVLWLLTIWIPYVNVGTTIAIITLPAAISKGETINPLKIFDKANYRPMGEFFLAAGLRSLIISFAFIFLIIPGVVMQIAYTLTILLVVDKGKGASEALRLSNRATFGHKWTIFFWLLFYSIVLIMIPIWILSLIWDPLSFIWLIVISVVGLGGKAYIYGKLTEDIPEEV